MYTHGIKVFNRTDNDTVVVFISHNFHFVFFPTNQRFVEAAIGFPKDKKTARGIFIAPLGILLQAGMQLQIDDGQVYKFQVRYCDNGGCYGYVDLNDQLLAAMGKGQKLKLKFMTLAQKNMNVEVSLKGFSDAIKEIS